MQIMHRLRPARGQHLNDIARPSFPTPTGYEDHLPIEMTG